MMSNPSRDARTTSLPHGEMDAEPTGLSRLNEPPGLNVGLSKAEVRPLDSSLPLIAFFCCGEEIV